LGNGISGGLPPILPIIVYHGERNFKAPILLGKLIRPIKGFEKYQLDFEAILLDLMDFDKANPPEDVELYAVLAIMQAVFRPDVAERILKIYRKIKHKLGDSQYRDRWLKILRYAMSSSKYMTRKDVMEVTNQMSETDVATISPFYQELLAEGRDEGCEKMIETLLRYLTRNFGEVPFNVRDRLYAIHDLDVLGQLTEVAWDCQSLTEFEAALKK